jgi:Sulfotransferase domain
VPPPPTPCPPDQRIGPPDFVGMGGQRCGTTRWFRLIASHPEVAVPPLSKELHYFDRFFGGGFTGDDAECYREYFPRREGQIAGEWTPLYASAPWIPRLLARAAPDAKLLMLVRDPVERFASGLKHNGRLSREQGMPLSRLAPVEAFARGLYHAQLQGVLDHFDRSQILVQQYERCSREPLPELRRTLDFIGVTDPGFVPPGLDTNPNPQPSKPKLDSDTRDCYARAYRDDVIALANAFPEIDLGLWPNFADLVD